MAQTMPRGADHDVKPIRRRAKPLPWPFSVYQTAVGKKYVMAITGVGLLGFVVVHMLGNLKLYQGPTDIHLYAEGLRTLGKPFLPELTILWLLRLGLLGMFGAHIHAAWSLSRMSAKADQGYASKRDYIAVSFASRTMRWTGPIILLYLFYHLADLTLGWTNDEFVKGDVYANVANSLGALPVAIIYIVASVALSVHVYHGAWSMFQSLGINNPRYNGARRRFAQGIAALLLIGNLSFPLSVQGGLIDLDGHTPGVYEIEETK